MLERSGMTELYRNVEMPLEHVLFDMESAGFMLDREVLCSLGETMAARYEELAKEIHALAGESFNILSPKQLSVVLFEKLCLPPRKKTKTGYSTDSEVLEGLKTMHPIVGKVLEYRFLTKLKSTFIDAMLQKIGSDGRIRTTLNQNVLVDADYSQIELRVLAHISGDEALIAAFNDGDDIHTRTAAEVFGVPKDEVTREMRSAAKAVNFGIVYGISAYGLSEQLDISPKKASEYIEKYLDRCTGVRNYMKAAVENGREKGYAVTIMGRRRELPEIVSSNHNTRSFGERVAMNMPIQGSAADIIKAAMVKVANSLKEQGLRARLILQIHDELIIDTPEEETERVKALLSDCMSNVVKLRVPLKADVECGHSWFDTK